MDDLINAHQATPLTGRAYNVVLSHIRKDYQCLQTGRPTLVFHTIVKREGSRPKWWVSEADARAFGATTLAPGVDRRRDLLDAADRRRGVK